MIRIIKVVMQAVGLWAIALRIHRIARWMQGLAYAVAAGLKLDFAVQLWLMPSQFLERPIYIRPSSITRRLISPGLPAFNPISKGDWDLQAEPIFPAFLDVIHFKLMYEMFAEGVPIRETSQYIKMEQEIFTKGETVDHGFHSIEEVVQHLEEYEQLFADIKHNGYKSQEEVGNSPFLHEMKVCIGRDGEPLYLTQGTHRLAMAKILDLERIPVGIWSVHEIWAQRCLKKYGGGVLESVWKGLTDFNHDHQGHAIPSRPPASPPTELDGSRNLAEPQSGDY